APVPGHEVDHLGGDLLGGDGEVSLIFAVLVVAHDDHLAVADRLDGRINRRKRRAWLPSVPLRCHRYAFPMRPGADTSIARSTYLPRMSHSRLTTSFTLMLRRFVCSQVYGMICTSNRFSSTPATVRLIPSTEIDPFRTIHAASAPGNLMVSHHDSPSWRISSIVPVASTCPCTKCPP